MIDVLNETDDLVVSEADKELYGFVMHSQAFPWAQSC
jgi:hypothetical protein